MLGCRVSSRLDCPASIVLVSMEDGRIVRRQEMRWTHVNPPAKIRMVVQEGVDVLICGPTGNCQPCFWIVTLRSLPESGGKLSRCLINSCGMCYTIVDKQDMNTENPPEEGTLSGKSILFILPPSQFRDEEYSTPKAILEKSGARITVASSSLSPARGMLGTVVNPEVTIENLNNRSFDAVVLVGGVGSSKFWHNTTVHRIVREAQGAGKVVSAICLAPVTLANAGLLLGKRATAYPSARSFLEWKGARYTGKPVETADNIVTANGPEAAEEFARTVAGLMLQKESTPETPIESPSGSEVNDDKLRCD